MISPDISIENEGWQKFNIETIVSACLSSLEAEAPDGMRPGEVVLLFTDNDAVHELNREWRGKDKPTNVLSFPMLERADLLDLAPEGPPEMLGDLALAFGTCQREAAEKGVSVADHATHLIVHGTLHLVGYDHVDDHGAEAMEALEVKALASLGIANPYAVQD